MVDVKNQENREVFIAEEIVEALYQGMLRRAPDHDGFDHHVDVVKKYGVLPLIQGFIGSAEFKHSYSRVALEAQTKATSGADLNFAPRNEVEIQLSEDDRAKLWKHIQKVWTKFGEEEPHWSVLTNDQFRASQIRQGNRVDAFFQSGAHDLKYFEAFLRRNDVEPPKDAVIAEFGCGLGRVTRFLARRFARVLAFDISPSHLAAASERLRSENIDNVEFILLDGPDGLSKLRSVDIFFSFIVLQHNPPPIICDVLNRAFDGLSKGGIAFFQVPTYGLDYKFTLQRYFEGLYNKEEMEIHFVPQRNIFQLLNRHGLVPLEVRPDHCIGNYERWISNTFLARKVD
jgi:SAM-dependent methyltransferase